MERVESGAIKIRPKIYFILGGIFSIIGLVGSLLSIIYISSLGRFLLKSHGPMGVYRWNELVSALPLWFVPLAIISVALGLTLLRRFDFSYRKNPMLVLLGLILTILIVIYAIGVLGLDEVMFRRRGPRYQEQKPEGAIQRGLTEYPPLYVVETSPKIEAGK
ncbi:MAG: hypothetical protein UW88_C0014G0014 [Candidatus Collierbacteria bacterium GW2011_GWD2_45_10]|nr:MAG: hypothetical protein UW31_C0012G0014 [Candidatus Collierbacteria bacterium GW2011_GWA2_44_13]KKT61274.1 MAG: hypothetical protein UW56_C0029G0014 [Candidatus Collierbacteria bacterium GW2011_GWD1_44_27]KKT65992.1 MAG: hypothetical protein UW58_C0015G0014 [Candidatus Collierbacteria bacterium GW2011_GWC2_44_30]KKT88149.1 MAG: hypothetical protein UW88_C0014G0014 [Candidatus Collierbacteria bacterium GW2011_GWD2_45_10]